MAEAVDGKNWQIIGSLAQVLQRMRELESVRCQEVHGCCKRNITCLENTTEFVKSENNTPNQYLLHQYIVCFVIPKQSHQSYHIQQSQRYTTVLLMC